MGALLVALLLFQVSPARTGAVTGVVISGSGIAAAGVRVYAIPAGDPNVAAIAGTVFVGLVQTDASGRYRLEVPAGRYYIAAGSVDSPTYYPNDTNITSARIVAVLNDAIVQDINFSKYVPAPPAVGQRGGGLPPSLPPGSTGILSGVIHFSDGSPASGIAVVILPVSILTSAAAGTGAPLPRAAISQIQSLTSSQTPASLATLMASIRLAGGGIRAITDNAGRYRIESVSPDTYFIMAGYADSPTFYPGTSDFKVATTITTTPSTAMDTLHFIIPDVRGSTVRVRVLAKAGRPAGGSTVELNGFDTPVNVAAFLPQRVYRAVTTRVDGSAEFSGVVTGNYRLGVRLYPASPVSRTIEVKDKPLEAEVSLPLNIVTGKILWDDSSPVSDPLLNQVAFRTADGPNSISTTVFSTSQDGSFKGVLAADGYRVFIRNLPQEYQIRSMSSGTMDLTKNALKFDDEHPVDVDIRISRRPQPAANVSGRILDARTGMPPVADRVQICCFAAGPFERTSTELHPDGSFEFTDVPPGRYELELKGKTAVRFLNPLVEVGDQEQTRLNLFSAPQFVNVGTVISTDGSIRWPEGSQVSVTFAPTSGEAYRITASGRVDEVLGADVPMGIPYDLSISGMPSGVKVKSLSGTDSPKFAPTASSPPGYAGAYMAAANSSILIILSRSD